MIRKGIIWTLFSLFAAVCIVWLAMLVIDAVKSESMRMRAKELRAERAAKAEGPIVIGAAGDWDSIYQPALNGITLASEEINRSGGVLNRSIGIVPKDDNLSVVTGMKVAQELADDINVVAVVGHCNSPVSLSTSTIYEYFGLLMLSPLSSHPRLTRQGHQLVFRNIPTDNSIGEQLAGFAARQGHKRIAIYYLQEDYARELANIFEKRCEELGIDIADRLHYDATYREQDFKNDFSIWRKQFNIDAIMLAGLLPQAADCVREIRKAGFDVPILTGMNMDNQELIDRAGKAAENTFIAAIFHPYAKNPKVVAFREAYLARYGIVPDRAAAQGYDALKLLAYVIQQTGSTVPAKMADTLRSVKNWQGVTGIHTFDKSGDVIDKPIMIKMVRDGQFQMVDTSNDGEHG